MSLTQRRDTVTVEGPDAAKFLQGQLSNDVVALAVGASCWSFLLDPSGKLGFVVRVCRQGDESFLLDGDEGSGAGIERRLRRFLIRTKATISVGTSIIDVDGVGTGPALLGWWADGVHRVVADEAEVDAVEVDDANADELEQRRIRSGWPAWGHEVVDGLIPGETGLVPLAASFTKGCYTGQELVARIDSRGNNVPKLLHRIRLTAPAATGDEIIHDAKSVGALTSVAGLDALGYLHRTVSAGASLLVGGQPATSASLRPEA